MPELAIGTALPTGLVKDILASAIEIGYRHIDLADRYASMDFVAGMYNNPTEYFLAVKDGLREGMLRAGIRRHDMWITLKASGDIPGTLDRFGLDYVDVCIAPPIVLRDSKGLRPSRVRHWGVENVRGNEVVSDDIEYVQLQAKNTSDIDAWIQRGRHVQLYSAVSALEGGEPYLVPVEDREAVIRYFMARYICKQSNTLIVGSQTGSSLKRNMEILAEVMSDECRVGDADMRVTRRLLKTAIDR